jgi:hypothetical protein
LWGIATDEREENVRPGRTEKDVAKVTISLEPYGFWSYARKDDTLAGHKISQLHARIRAELELDYGDQLTLFRDTSDITTGAEWERTITGAIAKSSFMIPVITPTFLKRRWCMREVRLFLEREAELRRRHPELTERGMIFPIGYREIRDSEALDSDIMAVLRTRQWIEIERLRDRDFSDPELSAEIGKLRRDVDKLLHIEMESKEEPQRGPPLANEQRIAREAAADAAPVDAAADLRREQQLEEEQKLNAHERRAKSTRDAAAKRAAVWTRWRDEFRRYAIPVTVGVLLLTALIVIAVLLYRPRATDPTQDRVASDNGSVEATNEIESAATNTLSGGPHMPPPLPAHSWLHGRWGIEDDCNSTISIDGTETTLNVISAFRYSSRQIRGQPTPASVQTDQGTYALQPDGSMRSSEPDLRGLRLTRCPPLAPQTGAAGLETVPYDQIQLGAFPTGTAAADTWRTLARRFRYLAPLRYQAVASTRGSRTIYRLVASGPQAAAICLRLRSAGQSCDLRESETLAR